MRDRRNSAEAAEPPGQAGWRKVFAPGPVPGVQRLLHYSPQRSGGKGTGPPEGVPALNLSGPCRRDGSLDPFASFAGKLFVAVTYSMLPQTTLKRYLAVVQRDNRGR